MIFYILWLREVDFGFIFFGWETREFALLSLALALVWIFVFRAEPPADYETEHRVEVVATDIDGLTAQGTFKLVKTDSD